MFLLQSNHDDSLDFSNMYVLRMLFKKRTPVWIIESKLHKKPQDSVFFYIFIKGCTCPQSHLFFFILNNILFTLF